ncbi:hypothetical protein D5086_012538 [Populus alba]|uniref:Uncharacterized protein n=1 Tax=Populus alba TaxID=43335 RepID=A0ACC4C3N4_POPAL
MIRCRERAGSDAYIVSEEKGSLNLLSLMLANQGKKEEGGRCFTILLAVGGRYIALPFLTAFDVTLAGCDSSTHPRKWIFKTHS